MRELDRRVHGGEVAQVDSPQVDSGDHPSGFPTPGNDRMAMIGQLREQTAAHPSARSGYENLHDPQFPPVARSVLQTLRKNV